MKRFWKRSTRTSQIEADLRRDRPTPAPELLDRMLGLLDEPYAPLPRSQRRSRPVMAALVAAVALVAFAVFGGLGYAKSSSSNALSHAAHSFGKIVKSDSSSTQGKKNDEKGKQNGDNDEHLGFKSKDDEDGDDPGDDQYREKVLICHAAPPDKPKQYITLKLSPSGAAAHLANHPFDYEGPCENDHKDK